MGNDAALAVLSDRAPPLFTYFKQLFAQVTNPPIDPIRESIVMSLATGVGSERNLLDETPEHAHQLVMDQPILRNDELETLRHVSSDVFRAHTIDITWPVEDGPEGMTGRLAQRLRRGARRRSPPASTSSSCPTAAPGPAARRSRRCSPSRPSTTTSCALGNRLQRGPRARVRRAARGPPLRDADRLRRQRDQPVPAARHRRRARRRGPHPRRRRRRRRQARTSSRRSARAC